METIRLAHGVEMPVVGTGTNTFGKEDHQYMGAITGDTSELKHAIAVGYRHFDTAISYRNETVVGDALHDSGVDRSEFFVTTKIPGRPEYVGTDAAVHDAIRGSLRDLRTDYIDLLLIHHPWEDLDEIVYVWKMLESYVDEGIIKAIGVSNFDEKELTHLLQHARIKPAVNQIQSHPGHWNDAIIAFCQKHGIVPVAWGPLTRIHDDARAELVKIGEKYGKTWAQVALRYQVERGVVVIPKSHDVERQKQNLDIFDFELTEEEKLKISQL